MARWQPCDDPIRQIFALFSVSEKVALSDQEIIESDQISLMNLRRRLVFAENRLFWRQKIGESYEQLMGVL